MMTEDDWTHERPSRDGLQELTALLTLTVCASSRHQHAAQNGNNTMTGSIRFDGISLLHAMMMVSAISQRLCDQA